jgi:AcrR family transcriptional regulator
MERNTCSHYRDGRAAACGQSAENLVLRKNTPHKVYAQVARNIDLPILHIGDATGLAIRNSGLKRVGLIGTLYTMEDGFMADWLKEHYGIETLVPSSGPARKELHRIIQEELGRGIFRPESKKYVLEQIEELQKQGAQGIVLGAPNFRWRKGYLGTSLSDLTAAMGVNRPSLYTAFGNKKSLFRKVLDRYSKGPSVYLSEALREPTARAVVERVFHGVVELLTDPRTPTTCMWVHGALSCGADPWRKEFAAQRVAGFEELRADLDTLANFVQTVNFGLTVQASTGATRKDLLCVVAAALQAWPK